MGYIAAGEMRNGVEYGPILPNPSINLDPPNQEKADCTGKLDSLAIVYSLYILYIIHPIKKWNILEHAAHQVKQTIFC